MDVVEEYDDDDDTGDDVEGDHQIHCSHYNHEELYVVSLLLYDCPAVFHVSHVHCFPSQVKVQHHPLCTCDLLVFVIIQSHPSLQITNQSQSGTDFS